jgi:hypothetical protein
MKHKWVVLGSLLLLGAHPIQQRQPALTFFITSAGSGNGANLGGLKGADKICQTLADAAGSKSVLWHAYLSTLPANGKPGVYARDRIGKGPWYNAKGTKVADNVADLHSDNNKLNKENALTEKGAVVNGRGDTPNMHDILTGSKLDGTAYVGEGYTNCDNWTGSGEGSARVGHHDRQGGGEYPTSWNSAHNSRGCSQANLVATGGNGLFYCFGIAG